MMIGRLITRSVPGDIRIDYLRDPADRGQSTDAAPSTELLLFYIIRLLRHYCWTFCDMLWNYIRIEGLFLRRGVFQACQAMDGAVLVNNRSSVTFDVYSVGCPASGCR